MTFDLSKPCQYRNGTPVRILCTDKPGLLTVVSMDETGCIWLHAANGHCAGDRRDLDLINVPEKREPRRWYVNAYPTWLGPLQNAKAEAEADAGDNRIELIEVVEVFREP